MSCGASGGLRPRDCGEGKSHHAIGVALCNQELILALSQEFKKPRPRWATAGFQPKG